jgi:type I restriction enzyme S subunit
VTIPAIKNILIPYPEIHEQKSISDYLQKELSKSDRLLHEIQMSMNLLREYRTALISAAVTGKIDVRDFRAEAAS